MPIVDDLEEHWAYLKAGRPPRPEPPPPPSEPKGSSLVVWIGLTDINDQEVSYDGYRRQIVTKDSGAITFPTMLGGTVTVHGAALYREGQGPNTLFHPFRLAATLTLMTGTTPSFAVGGLMLGGFTLQQALARSPTYDHLLRMMVSTG